jgi:hypothetical protein
MNKQKVLIFGHSDADGHIITQQSIENLEKEDFFVQKVVVNNKITKNYKFWEKSFAQYDFEKFDVILVVDIMFEPKNPIATFNVIKKCAENNTSKQFIIIDHHPIKNLPKTPENLKLTFTNSVYKCCYGKPSDLMIIASICDKDEKPVQAMVSEFYRNIAKGITRAATDHNGLAGNLLIHLIKKRAWLIFETLANEPPSFHKTFYGNRTAKAVESPILLFAHSIQDNNQFL